MGEARTIRGETRWLYRPREPALRTGERLRVGVAEVVDALLDVVFVEVTAPGYDLGGATQKLAEAGLKVSDRGADEGARAFLVVRAEAEEVLRALGEADESAGFSTEPTATALEPVPAPRLARPARRVAFPLEDATDPPAWEEEPITRPTPVGGGAPPAVVAAVPLGLAAAMVLGALGLALVGLAVTAWQRSGEAAAAMGAPAAARAAAAEAPMPARTGGAGPGEVASALGEAGDAEDPAATGRAPEGTAPVGAAPEGTGAAPSAGGTSAGETSAGSTSAGSSSAGGTVATGATAPGTPDPGAARPGATKATTTSAVATARDPARPAAGAAPAAEAAADAARWASLEAREVSVSFGTRGGFGYRLKVDGGPAAELPVRGLKLRPGRHEVWVGSVDGSRVESFVIEVPDAPTASWVCDWSRATNPCREVGG